MSVLVTDAELAELQSLQPLLDIKLPSRQLQHAVVLHLRGMSQRAAAHAAGYTEPSALWRFMNSDAGKAIVEYVQQKHLSDIRVTRERLTNMLFEAHAKAASATEEVTAIRELARLHDLYPGDQRKGGTVNVNVQNNTLNVQNAKQIERMTDEELMKLAAPRLSGIGVLPANQPPPTSEEPYDGYDRILDV